MVFNQAAMQRFADYTVANVNGRLYDLAGGDLNMDKRYGYQCMDLWIWIRYRLGFTDNLPTPDAASIWEMNWTDPGHRMWSHFDAITSNQPAMPGDIGIMNRSFFGNGVGHIFMIIADLGPDIEVLELNGLGDGFEDDAGGQHGSPGRIQVWPKTHLYGYLRWIGQEPTHALTSIITPIDPTPEEFEEFLMAFSDQDKTEILTHLRNISTTQLEQGKLLNVVHRNVSRYVDSPISAIPKKLLAFPFRKQGKDEKGFEFAPDKTTTVGDELGWQDANFIAVRKRITEATK